MQANADDVIPEQARIAADALCAAAADGAMKAYDHAVENNPALDRSSANKEPDMRAMQGG